MDLCKAIPIRRTWVRACKTVACSGDVRNRMVGGFQELTLAALRRRALALAHAPSNSSVPTGASCGICGAIRLAKEVFDDMAQVGKQAAPARKEGRQDLEDSKYILPVRPTPGGDEQPAFIGESSGYRAICRACDRRSPTRVPRPRFPPGSYSRRNRHDRQDNAGMPFGTRPGAANGRPDAWR